MLGDSWTIEGGNARHWKLCRLRDYLAGARDRRIASERWAARGDRELANSCRLISVKLLDFAGECRRIGFPVRP
jgi:hypothetical protein